MCIINVLLSQSQQGFWQRVSVNLSGQYLDQCGQRLEDILKIGSFNASIF